MYNIGTIQSSTQSYFNNCYIYMFIGEITECHGSSQFKERGM